MIECPAVPLALMPLQLSYPPPSNRLLLSVVVPVRNEAAGLIKTLAALANQVDPMGAALDPACYEVLVLANNCTDETAEIAHRFARRNPSLTLHLAEISLPPPLAHVGAARRLLMDAACRRLFGNGRLQGVIASTDGDTQVAPHWVFQTLRETALGVDAVGGRIRIARSGFADPAARLYSLRDQAYQRGLAKLESAVDPDPADLWPCHSQFFGASLAVTVSAYCRVGGLPLLPCLEDVALGEALHRMDARIRHSSAVRVTTSSRQQGRVAQGLSAQLREWGQMGRVGHDHWVQQPAAVEVRLHARRALRCAWSQGDISNAARLADTLAVPFSVLQKGLAQPGQPFGALWAEILARHREPDGAWSRRWPLTEITHALSDLRCRLGRCESDSLQHIEPVRSFAMSV